MSIESSRLIKQNSFEFDDGWITRGVTSKHDCVCSLILTTELFLAAVSVAVLDAYLDSGHCYDNPVGQSRTASICKQTLLKHCIKFYTNYNKKRTAKMAGTYLFATFHEPRDSKVTFRASSQAATFYHSRWRLHTVSFNAERQVRNL